MQRCIRRIAASAWSLAKRNRSVILLYVVTFTISLPLLFVALNEACLKRSIYASLSALSDTGSKEDRINAYNQLNDANINISVAYLHSLEPNSKRWSPMTQAPSEDTVRVTVGIPSIVRNKQGKSGNYQPRYLTQVVAAYKRFLSIVPGAYPDTYRPMEFNVIVCNGETDPKEHREARELSKYIDVVERNSIVSYDNTFEKEKLDYVFCLNSTLSTDSQWLLLAEDDALPLSDIRAVLEHLIFVRLANRAETVLSVKLYHPDRLLGYLRPTPGKVLELLCTGLLFGTLTWGLMNCIRSKAVHGNQFLLYALVAYYALLALAVGRVNLLELRRVSYQLFNLAPAPSCCTPAVLFTRHGAEAAMAYLDSTRCKAGRGKDTALEDLYRQTSLRALILEPSSYVHIGVYTALRDSLVDPRDV